MRYAPLIFGAAALALMAGHSPANAQAKKCSLETLNGRYLDGGGEGRIFPPAFGVTKESVSAVAGYSVYNGDGTGADFVTFTVNGNVVPVPAVQHTTYTLNADCTGMKSVSGGPTFNIYVAPDGSTFTEVATGAPEVPGSSVLVPGFAVSATVIRVVSFSENQQ
jgi:hypothetical protein